MNKKKVIIAAITATAAAIAAVIGVRLYARHNSGLVSVEQAREELNDFSFSDYENLDFMCDVDLFDTDRLYEISAEVRNTVTESDKSRCMELLGIFSKKDYSKSIPEDNGYMYEYDDEEFGVQYYGSGTFNVWNNSLSDIMYQSEITANKNDRFSLDEGSVSLYGKQIDIAELETKISKILKEDYLEYINKDDTIIPKYAVKAKNTDGFEFIVIRFIHSFKGLEFNDSGFPSTDDSFIRPGFIDVLVDDNEDIIRISNSYYFNIIDTNEVSDIISISDAADNLSKILAPYLKYKVTEVGLKYVCKTCQGETELRYVPMWCFTLDEFNGNDTEYFPKTTAFVDAQSGDVYLSNNKDDTFEEYKNE